MKLFEIMRARMTVAMLYKEKVAGKLAYKFLKFLSATETDEKFDKEKLQEIIEKYGKEALHKMLKKTMTLMEFMFEWLL